MSLCICVKIIQIFNMYNDAVNIKLTEFLNESDVSMFAVHTWLLREITLEVL